MCRNVQEYANLHIKQNKKQMLLPDFGAQETASDSCFLSQI